MKAVGCVVGLGLLVLLAPAPAQGQSGGDSRPTEAELAEARALFVAGERDIEAGRWANAVEAFTRSYELSSAPASLFNSAYALRALGRYRESRDAFARLIVQHGAELDRSVIEQAETYLAEVGSNVSRLVLVGLPESARVQADGEMVDDDGERPLSVELDPGRHVLMAELEGARPFTWTGQLSAGEEERLTVSFENASAPDALESALTPGEQAPTEVAGEDGGSVFDSPWLWTVVGLVVVGAGVGLGYFFLHDDQLLEPMSNRTFEL